MSLLAQCECNAGIVIHWLVDDIAVIQFHLCFDLSFLFKVL